MALFNIRRDNQLIANGTPFWCEACLVARPITQQSPDGRYCQFCYELLLEEAQGLIDKMEWSADGVFYCDDKAWGIAPSL